MRRACESRQIGPPIRPPVTARIAHVPETGAQPAALAGSFDNRRVLAEPFRVLKPGGQLPVGHVVVRGAVPAKARRSIEPWVGGCMDGALETSEITGLLAEIGFAGADIDPTRVYRSVDARAFHKERGIHHRGPEPASTSRATGMSRPDDCASAEGELWPILVFERC